MLQLAQSVLKIGFALAKKVGEAGRFQHRVLCIWQLPCLAVEEPWSALAWTFLSFVTQMGVGKAPLPILGSISGTVGSYQSGEALTIVSSLMSGRSRGHEP